MVYGILYFLSVDHVVHILYFLRRLMLGCEHDGKCRFFVAGNSQPLRDGEIAEQILKWKGWDGNRQKECKMYRKEGLGTYKKNTKVKERMGWEHTNIARITNAVQCHS